jgi:hypothetical protein
MRNNMRRYFWGHEGQYNTVAPFGHLNYQSLGHTNFSWADTNDKKDTIKLFKSREMLENHWLIIKRCTYAGGRGMVG